MQDVPEGFTPHFRKSGLTDPWEPLYSRTTDKAVQIGLRAAPSHANSRGMVHGALLTALADNAMGLSCGRALGGDVRLVTASLAIDFIAPGRLGQWLEVRPVVLSAKQGLSIVTATVHADDALCARVNATFRTVREQTTADAGARHFGLSGQGG